MPADLRQIDREAADWFLLLSEEPEDESLRERFEGWLNADPARSDAWTRIVAAGTALASAPVDDWNEVAAPSVLPVAGRRWARLPGYRAMVGLAAAAAIAIVILPSVSLRLQADHMTGTAQTESIRLADGSTIQLGPDSAVAVDYESGARQVRLLSGQAWFEVEPDRARPFRVTAGDVNTTVLGTGFEVSRLGSSTAVAVGHGRVRVSDGAMSSDLTVGQWVRIGSDHAVRRGTDHPEMFAAWRQGRLLVVNRTIADVIDDVRPWYKGRIILSDERLGQRRVTGFYDLRDPAVTLESLVHPDGGAVTRITPWLMIVSGT